MSDVTGISNQTSATDGATALAGIKAAVANLNTDKLEASSAAALTDKTTPVNADSFTITDSAASNVFKKLTFTNLKAFLKTYFDSLYPSGSGTSTGTNTGDNATNSQYSGLAASKQDALVSGTNLKSINSTSLLGSGNLVIAGGTMAFGQATRAVGSGTGTQNIAHGLGSTPSYVRIWATGFGTSGGGISMASSEGTGTASNNSCTWNCVSASTAPFAGQTSTILVIMATDGSTKLAEANISALDATNITLNFTTMSGGGLNVWWQWQAFK